MSHGLFGGLFSQRSAQAPPVPMGVEPFAEARVETEADRSFEYALDALPCNAMFCDRELILRYLNPSSRKALRTLQQFLRCLWIRSWASRSTSFTGTRRISTGFWARSIPGARMSLRTRQPSRWARGGL